jgi:hypothetical protein
MFDGHGILFYQDILDQSLVEQYCGCFKNGKIHGYGTLKLTNGSKIRGEFSNETLFNNILLTT